jgi:predicted nucleic acid-binding protein
MPAEFVDTNVLVYAYDQTAGKKHEIALQLMEKLWDSGEGVLSTQVLQEFYVTVTSKIPKPLSTRRAREIITDLATWTLATLDLPEILKASEISERYRLSIWDGPILAAAQKGRRRDRMVRGLKQRPKLRRTHGPQSVDSVSTRACCQQA